MPPDRKPSLLLLLLKLALLACVLGVLALGLSPLYRALMHATGLSPLAPPTVSPPVSGWPAGNGRAAILPTLRQERA